MKLSKVCVMCLSLLIFAGVVSAQEVKMKKEDWQNEMNTLGQQQTVLQKQIDSLNQSITGLKDEGAKVDQETEEIWKEIYAAIGTDKAGVDEMKAKLSALEATINDYAKMSDEMLSQKIKELDSVKALVDANRKDRRYALSEIYNKVNDLSNRCDQLIQRGKNYMPPKPKHDTYVVIDGDYLWRISSKKDVYSDPFQWMKIYSANRDQIRNPDLIFPRQSFLIPRAQEANEYWVMRGDNLKSIAQKVYGSPSDWVKLYNANKSIIGEDATRIYPHTILIVPKN
ncbi:LysM peptidoglycan-binding domain-containing protein [bacterium]|nr:LysM peptidoglycan-binding domain-containing protein [bacterium]